MLEDLRKNLSEKSKEIENLKAKIINMDIENDHLKNSLGEIIVKYESLRDIDSPIKEVSQMKKLIKKNDETITILKDENKDLKLKFQEIEQNTMKNLEIEDLQAKIYRLESENERINKISEEIHEKYESLRDLDSPIKEVSQMKKLLKQNDIVVDKLMKEKEELLTINEVLESKLKVEGKFNPIQEKIELMKENNQVLAEFRSKILMLENKKINDSEDFKGIIRVLDIEIDYLMKNLMEITEKYQKLRDADTPVKQVEEMKNIVKKNDENVEILKLENKEFKLKLQEIDKKSTEIE